MKDIKCHTPLYILKKYPTPEDISVLDKDKLGAEMKKQSRGKFREQHANMLIHLAKNTIGIREGVLGLSMDIRHILVQLEMLNTLIAEIESEMEMSLEGYPIVQSCFL
jgi:hypothetical protein